MPALALVPAVLVLLATPASAQETPGGDPSTGFPIILLVLAVVATVFALVWRTVSKRKNDQH